MIAWSLSENTEMYPWLAAAFLKKAFNQPCHLERAAASTDLGFYKINVYYRNTFNSMWLTWGMNIIKTQISALKIRNGMSVFLLPSLSIPMQAMI